MTRISDGDTVVPKIVADFDIFFLYTCLLRGILCYLVQPPKNVPDSFPQSHIAEIMDFYLIGL